MTDYTDVPKQPRINTKAIQKLKNEQQLLIKQFRANQSIEGVYSNQLRAHSKTMANSMDHLQAP